MPWWSTQGSTKHNLGAWRPRKRTRCACSTVPRPPQRRHSAGRFSTILIGAKPFVLLVSSQNCHHRPRLQNHCRHIFLSSSPLFVSPLSSSPSPLSSSSPFLSSPLSSSSSHCRHHRHRRHHRRHRRRHVFTGTFCPPIRYGAAFIVVTLQLHSHRCHRPALTIATNPPLFIHPLSRMKYMMGTGADPMNVADAIIEGCLARSPRRRYLVGSDAFMMAIFTVLPDFAGLFFSSVVVFVRSFVIFPFCLFYQQTKQITNITLYQNPISKNNSAYQNPISKYITIYQKKIALYQFCFRSLYVSYTALP